MEGIGGHPRKEKRVTFTSLSPNPSKKKSCSLPEESKKGFSLTKSICFQVER